MLGEKTKHARALKLTSREEKFLLSFAIGLCFLHALPLVKSTCFSRRHSCFFDGVLYSIRRAKKQLKVYIDVNVHHKNSNTDVLGKSFLIVLGVTDQKAWVILQIFLCLDLILYLSQNRQTWCNISSGKRIVGLFLVLGMLWYGSWL